MPHPAYASYEHSVVASILDAKLTNPHISGASCASATLNPPSTNCTAFQNSLNLYRSVNAVRKYTHTTQAATAVSSLSWSLDKPFSHRANRRIASEGAWFATIDNVVRWLLVREGPTDGADGGVRGEAREVIAVDVTAKS